MPTRQGAARGPRAGLASTLGLRGCSVRASRPPRESRRPVPEHKTQRRPGFRSGFLLAGENLESPLGTLKKKRSDLKKIVLVVTSRVTIHAPPPEETAHSRPIGRPMERSGSSSPRNPAGERAERAAGGARGPGWTPHRAPRHVTPGRELTLHHHCSAGGHLPVRVRGHRRVGRGVVEVCPGGGSRRRSRTCHGAAL